MRIRILRRALGDIATGRRFYDRQDRAVGDYFFDSLFSEIDSLTLYAGIHPKFFGFHRLLAKRFPYAIYYRVAEGDVLVYRVLDCRRHPSRTGTDLGGGDHSR